MKNLKTFKVVALSTDDQNASLGANKKGFRTPPLVGDALKHLYIISDEEIKEGDWHIDKETKNLSNASLKYVDNCFYEKVIATTDNLLKECDGCKRNKNTSGAIYTCSCSKLPQIPESFVGAYAQQDGISEVQLEMICGSCGLSGIDKFHHKMDCSYKDGSLLKIKLRDDGTVIIHPAKTYSRAEVGEKCQKAVRFYKQYGYFPKDEWIEQNL